MQKSFNDLKKGYQSFGQNNTHANCSLMKDLAVDGQKPQVMVIACCDSRVDPAIILQTGPGDIFMVRNIAAIVPPFSENAAPDSTSAALEFGICFLKIKHLILLGHSQCGGINALLEQNLTTTFIAPWVAVLEKNRTFQEYLTQQRKTASKTQDKTTLVNACTQEALHASYNNCLTFPWIKQRVEKKALAIHRWFFDIKQASIFEYSTATKNYDPLWQPPNA